MLLDAELYLDPADARDSQTAVSVVETDPMLRDEIVSVLGGFATAPFQTLEGMSIDPFAVERTQVLVLGPSQLDAASLDQAGEWKAGRVSGGVVLVVDAPSSEVLRLALRVGATDAVALDEIGHELAPVVRSVAQRIDLRAIPEPPADRSESTALGRITTVFSPKGGAGKSTVAVNLAAALARSGQPVTLVDLDVQFGDVAIMLRVQPLHSVVDATAMADRLDDVLLDSLTVRHDATGMKVLAAPAHPSASDDITAASLTSVLAALRRRPGHIIVDTPPRLDDVVLQLLSESDDIVYVVGMDVPSIKNASLGLQAFEVIDLPLERLLLVLNRADSKVHLEAKDVEKALRLKIDVALPSDAMVPRAANRGVPAVLTGDKAKFTVAIQRLAGLVNQRHAAAKHLEVTR